MRPRSFVSVPFERGSPDKNHSWDLMRSSCPGSSDPSQRRRSRSADRTAGDRYSAWLGARRRTGSAPRALVPAGHAGSRTDGRAPGLVRAGAEPAGEEPSDGEEANNEMRGKKTKEREQQPKRGKRKLNKATDDRGENERKRQSAS